MLKGFEAHGVIFRKQVSNQMNGDCPFCEGTDKFYVNIENRLWDCKVCQEKGNFQQFLKAIARRNEQTISKKQWQALSVDRGLPEAAFKGWGVGFDGNVYTIPVLDISGRCTDLRRYELGGRCQATPTATLGLLGAQELGQQGPVYVCEGEWDGFALKWLLGRVGKDGIVVAVPGASVFKKEWIPWFQNKEVVALYDNDNAGELGQKGLVEKLSNATQSLKVIHWPEGLPSGWDVRDHVKKFAVEEKRPKYTFKKLMLMVGTVSSPEKPASVMGAVPSATLPIRPVSAEETIAAYRKWLHLPDEECLQVMFGAALANKLQGDPIWLFLVAPPGGSKSELLSSLSKSPLVEMTTSLTPHSLVSGAHSYNGSDPSLLPKLNGRILVIKDFTTILSMHYSSRDEIFGVLRDAYDGRTEKIFGTGVKKTYISHFGILAGVTSAIEEFGAMHQSLGERFLKYRINTGKKTLSEADRIRRALQNINKENQMHEELAIIGARVLTRPIPEKLPTVQPEIFEYFVNLAQVCAMMRGVVVRDRFSGQVMYKPSTEVGTRLAKQLNKLSLGMAIYLGKKEVDWDIYRVARKTALHTAPDRVEEIIHRIWDACPKPKDAVRTSEVSSRTRLPVATCFRLLQDLELLKLIDRLGTGNKYEWRLGRRFKKLLAASRLYER